MEELYGKVFRTKYAFMECASFYSILYDNNVVMYIVNCLGVTFLSCLLAGILIPQILLISFRKKLFDLPDERKIHSSTVPRLGGIAFGPVILFSVLFTLALNIILPGLNIIPSLSENATMLFCCVCACILIYLVGIADDLIGVRYRAKFLVQIVAGSLIVASGLWISDFFGMLGIGEIPNSIGYPLTVFMAVFIINAINLIDGIDGLASGLTGVAFLVFGFVFFLLNDFIFALICFSTFGVLLPFFYFNVFGNASKRKKIFMGDTGSYTIGLLTIAVMLKILSHGEVLLQSGCNPMLLAFSPLIVPCFDVVRVVLHRFRNKANLFLPDTNHIHHKLLAVGLSQHAALISIVSFSLLLTICNILLNSFINENILLVIDILIFTIVNIFLSHIRNKNKND